MDETAIEAQLLQLEEAALARWCKGDPSGFLELSAPDVVYFDPFLDRRLDGIAALQDYYEGLRGKISAERFEILHPYVHAIGDAAVLTYNFTSRDKSGGAFHWNCTEVFRRHANSWQIIQSHWSFTKPQI